MKWIIKISVLNQVFQRAMQNIKRICKYIVASEMPDIDVAGQNASKPHKTHTLSLIGF